MRLNKNSKVESDCNILSICVKVNLRKGNWFINGSVMRCAIWYYLYNLKDVKKTHGEMLLLVKLQAKILQQLC